MQCVCDLQCSSMQESVYEVSVGAIERVQKLEPG